MERSCLVFFGDSITDAGRDRSDPNSLGDGYVSLLADEFRRRGAPVAVVNLGIAGNRAVDLEERWAREVAPLAPALVSIFVGINDTWRRFDSSDPTTAEAFSRSCRHLAGLTRAGRARLILLEPFLLPVRRDQLDWLGDLDEKRRVMRGLAEEFGAGFVPLQSLLSEAAADIGAEALAPDGVHPTARGSRLIADAWLRVHDEASDSR